MPLGSGGRRGPIQSAVDAAAATGTSSNVNSVFESGESVQVNTGWKNNGTTTASPTGLFSNFTGPVGPTYTITDATADYGPISPGSGASRTRIAVNSTPSWRSSSSRR